MKSDIEKSELYINVASDFSKFPFGRFKSDGPYSAQAFLEDILYPALKTHERIAVDLSYARALGSSFLEGVFGRLVSELNWTAEEFDRRIRIISRVVPTHKRIIRRYVLEASTQK